MSRFKTERIEPGVAMSLMNGALETISFGVLKTPVEVKMTDTRTGKTHKGSGGSTERAKNDAYSKFKK